MAKIISIEPADDGNDDTVTLLLDNGSEAVLKVDGDFITEDEFNAVRDIAEQSANNVMSLQAEIGALKQEIANRPEAPKALLHDEHIDVPVPRTLDKLSPLDALSPHKPLDEPQPLRLEDDPDAPARPPAADQANRGLDEAIAEAKAAEESTEKTD